MDRESQRIIESIVNECKSTVFVKKKKDSFSLLQGFELKIKFEREKENDNRRYNNN
jgi:hypothetical protein